MRESCRLAADCLVMVGKNIRPGMNTDEINTLVHEWIFDHGGFPSPLNYGSPPFPKSVCTSVNECVCHGIPSAKSVLKDGDIINVDVTIYYRGCHGDTSATFFVGEPGADAKRVVEASRRCLELGIATVRDGSMLNEIGKAIQTHSEAQGCSVVRDYAGHGVGREFHMKPQIVHYYNRRARQKLKSGMIFTIEPMINLGDCRTETLSDRWTVLSRDRSLSAQFEHTVAVTQEGVEVLTARSEPLQNSEDS